VKAPATTEQRDGYVLALSTLTSLPLGRIHATLYRPHSFVWYL